MQTIQVTDTINDKVIHLCPGHIVAYWWQSDRYTYVMLNGGNKSFATVKETPDEIDKLLEAI